MACWEIVTENLTDIQKEGEKNSSWMSWELEMQTGSEASLFCFRVSALPLASASLCTPTGLPLVMDLL